MFTPVFDPLTRAKMHFRDLVGYISLEQRLGTFTPEPVTVLDKARLFRQPVTHQAPLVMAAPNFGVFIDGSVPTVGMRVSEWARKRYQGLFCQYTVDDFFKYEITGNSFSYDMSVGMVTEYTRVLEAVLYPR